MKYLSAFLNAPPNPGSEIPASIPPEGPYKTYETPGETTREISDISPAGPYKTYETPPEDGFVGFVGSSGQETAEIEAPESGAVPSRPATPPTYGYTVGMRVVELAGRTEAENRRDPVKLVAGIGWTEWVPVDAENRKATNQQEATRDPRPAPIPGMVGPYRTPWGTWAYSDPSPDDPPIEAFGPPPEAAP